MRREPRIKKEYGFVLRIMAITLILVAMPVSAIAITDDAGMTTTFNATPLRIVSLSPSNTEILASLGLLDRVVGITEVCDYPPVVKNKTRVGGYATVNVEKVATTRPDLVIA
ncbi:MAG: ABC transporter substrate-binding protein [Methanomicrobiales archaeon]